MTVSTLFEFAASHDDRQRWGSGPLLVVRPAILTAMTPDEDTFAFDTPSRSTLATTKSSGRIEPGTIGDYLAPNAVVAPVRKTGGNPFPLVYVGRARNNDICIDDRSVSKVHAHFAQPDTPGARWGLKDAKSLNGTAVFTASGIQRLSDKPVLIDHGTEIRFGVVRCLFTDLETLQNAVMWAAKSW